LKACNGRNLAGFYIKASHIHAVVDGETGAAERLGCFWDVRSGLRFCGAGSGFPFIAR